MRNAQLKSDLDILLDLNRDYIRSVQTSDTRRFDEILADVKPKLEPASFSGIDFGTEIADADRAMARLILGRPKP